MSEGRLVVRLGVCVSKGSEWEALCKVAHDLVPGLCDRGCPFTPDRIRLVSTSAEPVRSPCGGIDAGLAVES